MRIVAALILSLSVIAGASAQALAPEGNQEREMSVHRPPYRGQIPSKPADPKGVIELREQMKQPGVPPIEYWEQVAICESSKDGYTADWRDKGRWSGGLGIYIGTWVRWGGRHFAPTPWQATKAEQMVVANRIAVLGFHFFTYSKQPVGFNGWGCIAKRKSLDPDRWIGKNKKP
jgi:hypothetical protein